MNSITHKFDCEQEVFVQYNNNIFKGTVRVIHTNTVKGLSTIKYTITHKLSSFESKTSPVIYNEVDVYSTTKDLTEAMVKNLTE